jgi:hypothetical protein
MIQIFLSELLQSDNFVIEKKYHKDNTCPLCLQSEKLENLKTELGNALKK